VSKSAFKIAGATFLALAAFVAVIIPAKVPDRRDGIRRTKNTAFLNNRR
jgi:hypothetical protein